MHGCATSITEDCSRSEKRDAERYRWLRDRLAIEDIERIEREFFGTPEEHESVKTDAAVDSAMGHNAALTGAEGARVEGTVMQRTNGESDGA